MLRNFSKFTGKYLRQSLFFNKVAGLRFATLLKKRLWHRRFPVNFAKFLRTPFLTKHLRWLLLHLFQVKVPLCLKAAVFMIPIDEDFSNNHNKLKRLLSKSNIHWNTLFFISNSILEVNVRVAWQIYVFKVKSCLGVA